MSERVVAGVDIGGTKTAVVLSSKLPQVLCRIAFETKPERGPDHALARILASLREALDSQGLGARALGSIGVSCGGPLDRERGVIQAPPNLSTWHDVPICTLLEKEFSAPCRIENDANAGALAEARFGAGRGCSNLIFLTMGTGLGAGLILNGQLYRGATDAAGEIGHVRLTKRGPKGFGKHGSAEGWASGAGMAQVARMYARAAAKRGEPTLLGRQKQLTGVEVAQAAAAGDRVAGEVVRKVGESLGEAIAILVDLFNPECVLVGGLALRFGDSLLGPAREVVQREALASSAKHCRILPAALGEQIGDLAALCAGDLAWRSLSAAD